MVGEDAVMLKDVKMRINKISVEDKAADKAITLVHG